MGARSAQVGGASRETMSMIDTRNGVPAIGSPQPVHRLASFSSNTVGIRMPMIAPPRNFVALTEAIVATSDVSLPGQASASTCGSSSRTSCARWSPASRRMSASAASASIAGR